MFPAVFLLNVELEPEPHAHITVHIKPDFGGELIPVADLQLHWKISEVLEAKMPRLREYHYYLKHKNEILHKDYTLECYGIKNWSIIKLCILVRREKIRSYPLLCEELESLQVESHAAEPLSLTRIAVAKPHYYENCVRRVELVDRSLLHMVKPCEMYPERGVLYYYEMLDPTTGATPHETYPARVAVADQSASYVIKDSTSQTPFPMKGDLSKLKSVSSKTCMLGTLEVCVLSDICTRTAEESELLVDSMPVPLHQGTTRHKKTNSEGVLINFDFEPQMFTDYFLPTVQSLKEDLFQKGLLSLSPDHQCMHFQQQQHPDERQLYEYNIQQGSKVYIHHKGDYHLDDHGSEDHIHPHDYNGRLSDGTLPVTTEPSSIQERTLVSVKVKFRGGEHQPSIGASETVGELKRQLYAKQIVPLLPENQCVIFRNRMVDDHETLESCGIQNNSTIHVYSHKEKEQLHAKTKKPVGVELKGFPDSSFDDLTEEVVSLKQNVQGVLRQLMKQWLEKNGMDIAVLRSYTVDIGTHTKKTMSLLPYYDTRTFKGNVKFFQLATLALEEINDSLTKDSLKTTFITNPLSTTGSREILPVQINKLPSVTSQHTANKEVNNDFARDMDFKSRLQSSLNKESKEHKALYLKKLITTKMLHIGVLVQVQIYDNNLKNLNFFTQGVSIFM